MNIPAHERARLDKLKALADRGATPGARAMCLDLNELLASLTASAEAMSDSMADILEAAAENIRGKSGKPPAR